MLCTTCLYRDRSPNSARKKRHLSYLPYTSGSIHRREMIFAFRDRANISLSIDVKLLKKD